MHGASENLFQVKNIKDLNFLSKFLKDSLSLCLCANKRENKLTVRRDITLPLGFLSNSPNMPT